MTVYPEPGQYVHVTQFDRVAPVEKYKGEWVLLDFGDGTAATRVEKLVVPSEHAIMRWRTRMWEPGEDGPGESEEIARRWRSGIEVADGHDMHGEEVRLDEDSGAVFVRKENAVATVIAPDHRKPRLESAIDAMGVGT